MKMKIARRVSGIAVVVAAIAVAGFAKADTSDPVKMINGSSAKSNLTELDDSQMERETAGATISYGALRSNNGSGGSRTQANSYSRGCSTQTRCRQ